MVYVGSSLYGHTDMHVRHGGKDWCKISGRGILCVCQTYASSIGDKFILTDDNALFYRPRLFDEYLEDQGTAARRVVRAVFHIRRHQL